MPLQFTQQHPQIGEKIRLNQQGSSLLLNGQMLMDTFSCNSDIFLSELTDYLSKQLKQHDDNNLYDKVIFLFRSWHMADSFLNWAKLAGYQSQIESLVAMIGVRKDMCDPKATTLIKLVTGWPVPGKVELGVSFHASDWSIFLRFTLWFRKNAFLIVHIVIY